MNNVTETNTGKSSVFTRSQFFSKLDDADKKIIKEFSTDPRPLGRGGLEFRALEAVNGEIASLFPDEIVYYDRFSSNVHTKDLSKALWSSIQTPETNLDEFIDAILVAQEYNKASIPIATNGHVFTLIKNNDEWAIIDQFGRNRYTSPKSIIKGVLLEAGVPENKILETMENLPEVARNRMDCYAYSSQVSFNNLTGSATAKDYASGYFVHDATDRHIQIMQQAAEMLVDVMGK